MQWAWASRDRYDGMIHNSYVMLTWNPFDNKIGEYPQSDSNYSNYLIIYNNIMYSILFLYFK